MHENSDKKVVERITKMLTESLKDLRISPSTRDVHIHITVNYASGGGATINTRGINV